MHPLDLSEGMLTLFFLVENGFNHVSSPTHRNPLLHLAP